MDSSALLPVAEAVPVDPLFLRVLLDATFVVHLLFMNAMLGLTLLGLVRSFRAGPGLAQQAAAVPTAAAFAVNLGVAPLLFLQVLYGQFLYVSSTLMGVYWFGLVLAVMAAYGLAYRQKHALLAGRGPGTLAWALMAALLLYATLVQTHNAILLIRPDLWHGYFQNSEGTLAAWGDPTLVPRWLHFVTASVAVGGLCLALIGRGRDNRGEADGQDLVAEGLAWFGWGTVAQATVGAWLLASLPMPVLLSFLGGNREATALLAAGLGLAGAAVAFAFRGRLLPAIITLGLLATVMVTIREMLRQFYLSPLFDPLKLPQRPEWSTVAMFLGCLALALGVIAWSLRAAPPAAKDPAGGA